jgi:hypothetical protein
VISGDRLGLHGAYTFLPAHDVATERSRSQVVVRGMVDDPRGLRVQRTIRSRVSWPLWDAGSRVETDAAEVRPRVDGTRIAIAAEEMV